MSRVDVGVVTWNTRDLSLAALRRTLAASADLDRRVLVRDNASSDGTAEAIASELPEVDLDAGSENLGFAAGVNTLLRRSDAPWFLLLNGDAWLEPRALPVLLEAAQREPRAAVVAPRLSRPGGGTEESTHRFPSLRQAAVLASGAYRLPGVGDRFLVPGYWRFDRSRVVDWAVGAAWLMRRSAIDDVGGFDERYIMYVEDLDWCWRAAQRGWKVCFEPDAVVAHVGNASGAQRYAGRRTAAWLHNTFAFGADVHGRLWAELFRGLNAVAAARMWLVARSRGDTASMARWSGHLRGSLARRPPEGAMRHQPA